MIEKAEVMTGTQSFYFPDQLLCSLYRVPAKISTSAEVPGIPADPARFVHGVRQELVA